MKTKPSLSAATDAIRNGAPPELREIAAAKKHLPMMADLYARAVAQMRTRRKAQKPRATLPESETDLHRLLHELQVHQIELELQNEELRKTRDEMETARDKYSDLYDFAPVGYLMLDRDGTIAEANLAGASLLGVARAALVKRRFGAFVSPADRAAFAAFLQRVFKSKAREECDMRLLLNGTEPVDVRIRGIVSSTGQACRLAVSDITAHKQAEGKVRESEERFRVMANAMPQLAWIARPDGHIFWYNQRWYDYTGATPKQMEGWGWQSVHDAGELPKVLKRWKASLATGDSFDMTFPLRGADGLFRPFLTRVIPLKNAADRVVQWFGTNTDVTEQKRAEDKVRVSEVRYRRLFETAHDGVLLLDPATRKITDANPFMTKLLDYPHDQLVGKELFEIGLLKDEVASREMFRKLKQTHEVRYEDLPLESQGGRHQEVEVVANLYQEDGRAVIQCNIRDITERKRVEQQLAEKARLLDLSHDAIIVRDMKGRIRYWNHGAEELYGWSRKEALGKVSHRLLQTEFPTPLKQMMAELLRTDRWIGELVHTTRAGRRLTVLARKTLDRDRQGRPVAVLENISDITERKQTEVALRVSERFNRSIIESSPDCIKVFDLKGNLLSILRGAKDLLGIDDVEPYLHTPWIKFWGRKNAQAGRQAIAAAVAGREGKFVGYFPTLRGELKWWDVRISPILDANDRPKQLLAISRDITDYKKSEEAQRRLDVMTASNRKLEQEIVRRQAVETSLRKSEQHQTQLLEQSRRLQEQLRQLSRQILTVQEEERRAISRELHDVIAQTLTGINVRLAGLKNEAARNTKGLDRNIARTQRLVEKSVDIVHQFARELRPAVLDDLGLVPALHAFMKCFTTRTGVRTRLTAFAAVEKLDGSRRTVLYRVAQEALTNVARHAKASRVDVSIQKLPGGVCMKIKDDGKSFDAERVLRTTGKERLGLLGMRERVEMVGGKFTVESAPGQGTTIVAHLPSGKNRTQGGGRRSPLKPRLKML